MALEFGAKTDIGTVRSNNEDNFSADEELGLFIVADGMGGHNAGEVASKMATEIITRNMRIFAKQKSNLARHLVSSIELANQSIYEASRKYAQNQGMGTTVVAGLLRDDTHIIGWVGDSRVYLIRHGNIEQLTLDHSLVQEQISKGLITPEQAEQSEYKNVLTRALGANENVQADVVEIPAFDEDYLVLCSDGLIRTVADEDILKIVKELKEPQSISEKLIDLAKETGGRDNITVITVHKKTKNIIEKIINMVK
ncbi:MAG: Stp1/IreP family PP2C-type Ser/Thr phosphatase [Endomicrobiales bacterium]|nr:Stp1/IreP family PP2C-type Ser/Thr phosphatase [Endomicrobiales bacterium]